MNYNENAIKNACNLIAKFEGLSLKPYTCPAGARTIGYGHRILPNEHFTLITKDIAKSLLYNDFINVLDTLHSLYPRIYGTELYALACLSYNVGLGWTNVNKNLGREVSVLNKWYSSGSLSEADAQRNVVYWMKKYCNYKDPKDGKYKPLNGLVLRRLAEVEFFKGQLEYYCPKHTKQIKI